MSFVISRIDFVSDIAIFVLKRDVKLQLTNSRIDYCNSVLVGLPVSTLASPQQVQNAAARLILSLSRRSHIAPALKQLHWLLIKFRIIFNHA